MRVEFLSKRSELRISCEGKVKADTHVARPPTKAKPAFTLAEVLITLGVIGVVAAMTIPGLMTAYKRHVIETRLKHSFSLLSQVVKQAQADYEEPSGWDLKSGSKEFVNTYFVPYMKSDVKLKYISQSGMEGNPYSLRLMNGSEWIIRRFVVNQHDPTNTYYHVMITVDINGNKKPNKQGIDRFNFYLFPGASKIYNTGNGDCAHNVPGAGIYYDGYGFSDDKLISYSWRGCRGEKIPGKDYDDEQGINSFCIALIIRNGWKLPENYPLKL